MLIALQIALLVIAALWIVMAIGAMRALRTLPRPVRLGAIGEGELAGRLVSVIIAARDEAGRIEETVRRALAQEGVAIEVIAVDDRSQDGTGESLDAMAGSDDRLRVVHITELPDGWLGKCHALHEGSRAARGDWLCFLDADTHLAANAVAGSLAVAIRAQVEHVTLLPDLVKPSFWGQVALGSFWTQMSDRARKVNNDHRNLFMGVGAFNMIERSTYDAFGGHGRLRLQVIDDMVLGLCVRKIGARTRVVLGPEVAEIEYGHDLPSATRLFEKNGYAALNYNPWLLALLTVVAPVMVVVPLLGPVWALALGAWAGWAALAGIALSAVPAVRMARSQGGSPLAAAITPIGHLFFLYAIVRSYVLTRRRGGIVWRETFYPLNELKAARLSWRVKEALPGMN
ncbi:MAG: glycosyltransferase [Phycisphaeraceae bacterium]|nr:glycosyltransferase [Phycisphaeraceae bacterium]MCB9847960.1 glycosyltransferase [Phycisphaeraceae bacterium]